jgi:hypothetical protein
LFVTIVAAALGGLPSAILHAQSPTLHGYITALHPPNGFDINGEHVITSAETRFGPIGARNPVSNGPMRDAIEIGAWAQVFGQQDRKAKTVAAQTVLFRDDWDRKLTGLGVIEKVISTAPELVFAADGYSIRVTAATEVKFPHDVKSAADVHADLWVLYEGKLDQDGLLVAGKIRFLSDKHAKAKPEKAAGDSGVAAAPPPPSTAEVAARNNAQPPNNAPRQKGFQGEVRGTEVQLGGISYMISNNPALQSRVQRVGMSLVPAWQKLLPDDDPSKIQFLFIAVDDTAREEHTSPDEDDLILVPAQLAARFKNEDQLAAVLADGIAFSLQQQAPQVTQLNRATMTEAGVMAAASFAGFAGLAAAGVYGHEYEKKALNEQRWRVALQLMSDAGYDPWQAPEAWRLAAPGKLPADTSTLKYPDRSGYQFAILNLTYKKPAPTNVTEGGSTANPSASRKP